MSLLTAKLFNGNKRMSAQELAARTGWPLWKVEQALVSLRAKGLIE